jgi:hypothetical protein
VKSRAGISPALVETVVYFGTDTHVHVRLDHGEDVFTVRQQNSRGASGAVSSAASACRHRDRRATMRPRS